MIAICRIPVGELGYGIPAECTIHQTLCADLGEAVGYGGEGGEGDHGVTLYRVYQSIFVQLHRKPSPE